MISQVVTALLLGIILIVFQTFSITQQSSWAQSPDEFVQYARKVLEVVQGAGVKGPIKEPLLPGSTISHYWTEGECKDEFNTFRGAACTKEGGRITIYQDEASNLGSFNAQIRNIQSSFFARLEEFDAGASQKGYYSHSEKAEISTHDPRTGLTQSLHASATGKAYFICGNVRGELDKYSLSASIPTPDSLTPEQFKQITAQKDAEAVSLSDEHKARLESLARSIVQVLIGNNLCKFPTSTPSQNVPAVPLSEVKTFDKPPWKFTYQVVDQQGLVLKNVTARDQLHFKSVAVPHFELIYSGNKIEIVRFNASSDTSRPVVGPTEIRKDVYTVSWGFDKTFDKPDLNGTLSINYEILVKSDRNRCEFVGKLIGINCFRFIPKVNFNWKGTVPQTLNEFTAFYRLDYGNVGIALDKNEDFTALNIWYDSFRIDLLTNETDFGATFRGQAPGTFDNIHTATPGQWVFVPGCRLGVPIGWLNVDQETGDTISGLKDLLTAGFPPFDCNHMHWRWGASGVMTTDPQSKLNWGVFPHVDVMVEPSTNETIPEDKRGQPYLVPEQQIRMAVVEEKATEEDPDYPILDTVNKDEVIAVTKPCPLPVVPNKLQRSPESCILESADPVRIWYVATTYGNNSDTFFRHGTYVVDVQAEYPVKTTLQGLRSALGTIETGAGTGAPTTTTALNENKVHEIIGHLDQALADQYWLSDGTLVPEQGAADRVFAELSQTANLMQDVKRNSQQDSQTVQLMDSATSTVLSTAHFLLLNAVNEGIQKMLTLSDEDIAKIENSLARSETLDASRLHYAAVLGNGVDLVNPAQIIDNFRLSWINTIIGMGELFGALGVAPPAAIAAPTSATATTPTTTPTTNTTATTATNGTTTTTTTTTPPTATTTPPITTTTLPSITAVDLHPDSVPQFFKCGETPDTGLPTLPGLDVQSSAYTAITDEDVNTEILGRAIFDVTFSGPITNGPGPDLRIYEIGNDPEPFNVTLFSGDILTQSIQYTASATGDTDDCGFGVNTAEIDLSDFGIGGEGEQGDNEEIIAITGIRVDNQGAEGCCTGADVSDVFVLTTTEQVPPSTTTTTTTPPPTTPGTNATATTTTTDGTTNTTSTTTTTPTSTCTDLPSGLVAWWPAAGNADDFLGNNDGVLQNGASFSGIVGNQAFRFDGVDDYVQIPSMNIGNTFSIDFWVYPEPSENYEHLISNHFASGDHFGALYLRDGNLEYWHNNAARFQQVPGSQTIQPNTWSHIALTYDGSVIRIYANGSELSGVTTTGNEHSETFNNAIRIGSSDPHESSYFKGLIDDVGLYNRALSVSEIQALSEVGKCSPTAAAATTTSGEGEEEEDVPLLPEQQLEQQLQQQDDEADAEGEEQQEGGQQGLAQGGGEGQLALTQCDPSYPDVCIPPPPPDLDCGDEGISENFQVLPPNPHGFDDEDNDGIGCETQQQPASDTTEPTDDGGEGDAEPESETEEDAEAAL